MKASGFHLPLCKREMLISTALFDNVKSFWHSNSLVHSYERRRERERVREGREGVREGREGQGGVTRQPFQGFGGAGAAGAPVTLAVQGDAFVANLNAATARLPGNGWALAETRVEVVAAGG